jgi:secondary thiamine-phosphate synthase enzyme
MTQLWDEAVLVERAQRPFLLDVDYHSVSWLSPHDERHHAVGTRRGARHHAVFATHDHRASISQGCDRYAAAVQSHYEEVTLETRGDGDVIDVTTLAQKMIANAGFHDGLCTVFVAHSTCGVTTIEFEPGCNADLNQVFDEIVPADRKWEHNERNADTNGHSHVRAAMIGPSVTVPFRSGELCIGTWQKVVCIDFDDRPRSRRLVVQLLGA